MNLLNQTSSFLDSSQSRWFFMIALLFVISLYIYIKRGGTMPKIGIQKSVDAYMIDLTAQASEGTIDPVVGRDEEISRVTQILTRRTKNNVILVGQPGVGKTAVVEGLAMRIATGDVPDVLIHKRVLLLQVAELMAGTKYRGEFEQRIKRVVEEIRSSKRTIILFIDEIHTVTQIKNTEGAMNLSDILKPALARGDLQLVGATTKKEYEQYIQPDESWDRRFQVVVVDEPTIEESIKILEGIKEKYEDYHKVKISNEAIAAAVRFSQEYIKGRRLPDKAIDIMDEAAAKINVERGSAHEHAAAILHGAAKKACENCETVAATLVTVEHVKEIVAEWVGMDAKDIH
jgi:ATP-dependent Clp protease ATP-binding subunit ClpA